MERNTSFAKWVRFPTRNELEEREHQEEAEEALSLCDLPLEEDDNQSRKEAPQTTKNQDDFDFCSLLKESDQMVAADEVFFQGQILPLRHSLSSSEGGLAASRSNSRNSSRCISRSESMERSYSSGFTSGSSRSSSIRSHQSSSSSGSSSTNTPNYKLPRVRNRFHYSHPSPRPQIKISNSRNKQLGNSNQKQSTIWSHFRLGLLTPPEIALQDLKSRSSNINNKVFGSRDSTGSNGSNTRANQKQKQLGGIFFNQNGALFGGCKCTVDAVVETVPSRVVTIRRSASENEVYSHDDQELDQLAAKGTKQQQQEGKQALSRHRTFEWLKQLSLEGQSAAADDDEA